MCWQQLSVLQSFTMSLLFENVYLVEVIYLVIRFNKTKFLPWNANNTKGYSAHKQNTYHHSLRERWDWKGLVWKGQAFTYCMHGYDRVCNVQANGVTRVQNSCKVLIRLSKTNLKLPICSSFFLSCLVAYSSPSSCCHTCSFAALIFCLSLWKPNLLPSYKTHISLSI